MDRIGTVMAFLLLTAAPAADAQTFNINAHCAELASVGGSHSNVIELACRRQEAAARDALTRMSVAPSVRQHCSELAAYGGGAGSYVLYKACVEQEQAAAKELGR